MTISLSLSFGVGGAPLHAVEVLASGNGRFLPGNVRNGVLVFATNVPLVAADTDSVLDVYTRSSATGEVALRTPGGPPLTGYYQPYLISGAEIGYVTTAFPPAPLISRNISTGAETPLFTLPTGALSGASFNPVWGTNFTGFQTFAFAPDNFTHSAVVNMATGAVQLVDRASDGTLANEGSSPPSVTADGSLAFFTSGASNLVIGDTNSFGDLFSKNLTTGETKRVVSGTGGAQPNNHIYRAILSPDGATLAFVSDATNLVPSLFLLPELGPFIYEMNLATGAIKCLSLKVASDDVSFSPDGRYIAYNTVASPGFPSQVLVYDRTKNDQYLISAAPDGTAGNGDSGAARWRQTAQGSLFLDFETKATNLGAPAGGAALAEGTIATAQAVAEEKRSVVLNATVGGANRVDVELDGQLVKSIVVPPDIIDQIIVALMFSSSPLSAGSNAFLKVSGIANTGGGGGGFAPAAVETVERSFDVVIATESRAAVTRNGGAGGDLMLLTDFADTAHGLAGDDYLKGNPGADTLRGGEGSDTLAGGAGQDSLDGGAGLDLAAASPFGFAYLDLQEAPGFFYDGASFDAIAGIEGAIGGDGADFLNGAVAGDALFGDDGADALLGRGGADTIEGGAGADYVMGGAYDAAASGTGADALSGGEGQDVLYGADGNDAIDGGPGVDFVLAGAGNDSVEGGDGDDFLFAGAAYVFNDAAAGADTIHGGAGIDLIHGGAGADRLDGGADGDIAYGGAGDDTVAGGSANDTLFGDAGGDLIAGGAGFDYLYGGAGADTFNFRKGDSYDTAWDFSATEGDRLRLDPMLGADTFAEFRARLTGFTFEGSAYTVLNFAPLGSNDQLTVKGIAPTAWTAAMVELA